MLSWHQFNHVQLLLEAPGLALPVPALRWIQSTNSCFDSDCFKCRSVLHYSNKTGKTNNIQSDIHVTRMIRMISYDILTRRRRRFYTLTAATRLHLKTSGLHLQHAVRHELDLNRSAEQKHRASAKAGISHKGKGLLSIEKPANLVKPDARNSRDLAK